MANRAVSFTFTTEDAQALAALKRMERGFKQLDVQVDKTKAGGERFGSTWASSLGGLALGAGVALAVTEFSEAEKVAAKTEAVIESTGGAAGKTADDIADLSSELSKMAAVDDDVVQNGANVLATFTKISGTTFDAALESALDLSAAMGTDLQSSVVMVGKALNDPIKGMTAMTKAGIQFTAQQKDQIRTLAESGDMLAAQGIILEELQTQFGGAAEANATSADRAKVAVGELAEGFGAILAPAVEVAADALGGVVGVLDGLPSSVQTVAVGAAGAAVAWGKWGDTLSQVGPALTTNVAELGKMGTAMAVVGAGAASFAAATEVLKELTDTDADLGAMRAGLEGVADGSTGLAQALSLAGTDIEELAGAFEKGATAPKDYGDAIQWMGSKLTSGLAPSTAQLIQSRNRVREFDDTLAAMVASGNIEGARSAFGEMATALREQGVSTEEISTMMPRFVDLLQQADQAAADAAASTTDLATGTSTMNEVFKDEALKNRADEMARLNDETERGRDLALAAASSEFAYMDAVDSTKDAQIALAEAKASGNPAEIERAERDLAEAMLRQAGAALANAEAQAVAEGRTLTNSDANAVLRGELDRTRETTGYWNDTLQTTADRLDFVQGTSDRVTQSMIDDVQAVNDKLREQADIIKWNTALFVNMANAALTGKPLGNGGLGMGGSTRPPVANGNGPTPGANGQGTIGAYRSMGGVTIVAPNLTRLGTPSEVNAAMAGAGRSMARYLARS